MATKIDDGGPAFPVSAGQQVYSHGMLLRDYLAGQVVAAMDWSDPTSHPMHPITQSGVEYHYKLLAKKAYSITDSLLAARTINNEK